MENYNHSKNPDSPLLSIPFVVRIKILCKLELKEQLALRQVCQTTKDWIDSSSLPSYHVPRTSILDNGKRTFAKFLEKKPSHVITSLFVENDSFDFLYDPLMPYFLRVYSPSIRKLRVKRFFTCGLDEEMKFYESFANLEEVEFDKISISSTAEVTQKFPRNFRHLKVLKIGDVKAIPEPPDDLFGAALIPLGRQRPMGLYVWNLISFCEHIEFLGYPNTSRYFFQAFIDGSGRGEFGAFCDYVRQRSLRNPKEFTLKYCDFRNDNWSPDSKNALSLLTLGNQLGIKFLNVNGNLFQYIKISSLTRMYELPSTTGDSILSFKKFNCLITERLPAIEKISMIASEVNTMLDYSCLFNGPIAFPNLNEIEITIDVGFTQPDPDKYQRAREFKDFHILLSHFFYDMEMILLEDQQECRNYAEIRVYEQVENLTIQFKDVQEKAAPEDLPLKWIVKGLPNLKKLKLIGWNAAREGTYATLWKGFPRLEQILLEDCDNITDSCLSGLKDLRDLVRLSVRQRREDVDQITKISEEINLRPSHFLNQCNQQGYITWIR